MGRNRKRDQHLPPRVYFLHGAYYFFEKNGPAHHLGRDLPAALLEYGKLMELPDKAKSMHHLFDRYMAEVAPKKAERTYKDHQKHILPLRAFFGQMRADDVRPQHIYQYLDVRGQKAPVQANREKSLLSHIFTMAIRWGAVDHNPCREVKRLPEKPRDRYIEDAELEAFCTIAPDIIKNLVRLQIPHRTTPARSAEHPHRPAPRRRHPRRNQKDR